MTGYFKVIKCVKPIGGPYCDKTKDTFSKRVNRKINYPISWKDFAHFIKIFQKIKRI